MTFGKLTCNNETYSLNSKTSLIGRTPSCVLTINHRSISKEHAFIDFIDRNRAVIKDLNSLNGTYINNQKLSPGQPHELKDNDKLSFGKEGSFYVFSYPEKEKQLSSSNKPKDFKISVIDNWKGEHEEPVSNMTAEFQRNNEQEEDLYKQEIRTLNEALFMKDELLHKKEGQIELLGNENRAIKEELDKRTAKLKALELFASDLQRKVDVLQSECEEKTRNLKDLSQKDWVKMIHENNQEVNTLRRVIFLKEQEVEEVKKQYKTIFQSSRNPTYSASEKILDQQIKELLSAKKQLIEYENNSLECNKRWKSLLQENIQKDEIIKGFTLQIERQIESFKQIYCQFDQKIKETHSKLLEIIDKNGQDESEAAHFLVQQMDIIQEEKLELMVNNERLRSQLEELNFESIDLRNRLHGYQNEYFSEGDDRNQVILRMKEKIEELEDFVVEIKEKEGIPKLIELNETVEALERKLNEKDEIIENLKLKHHSHAKKQISNENYPINEQNAIDFFSKLLQDKDKKIAFMEKEIELFEAKEKQKTQEMEKIKQESFSRGKSKQQYQSPDFSELTLMNENMI